VSIAAARLVSARRRLVSSTAGLTAGGSGSERTENRTELQPADERQAAFHGELLHPPDLARALVRGLLGEGVSLVGGVDQPVIEGRARVLPYVDPYPPVPLLSSARDLVEHDRLSDPARPDEDQLIRCAPFLSDRRDRVVDVVLQLLTASRDKWPGAVPRSVWTREDLRLHPTRYHARSRLSQAITTITQDRASPKGLRLAPRAPWAVTLARINARLARVAARRSRNRRPASNSLVPPPSTGVRARAHLRSNCRGPVPIRDCLQTRCGCRPSRNTCPRGR
jgi:hypothetical protein